VTETNRTTHGLRCLADPPGVATDELDAAREPSFVNLQAIPAMAEGGMIADVIAGGASLDPVMGGCDR
jgi:hypothetical protein